MGSAYGSRWLCVGRWVSLVSVVTPRVVEAAICCVVVAIERRRAGKVGNGDV